MTPDVAIAVSPRPWAQELQRFAHDHGGANVRAMVVNSRQALDEHYQVLVIDDVASFLTPKLVADVHRAGRRLLGVHDVLEPTGAQRLRELGVDDVVSTATDAATMLRHVDALVLAGHADLDRELAVLSNDHVATARFDPPPRQTGATGRLTVVGGPSGGGGITETALAVATGVVGRGDTTVLVDLDEVAPSIANRLGLPLHPNVRSLVDVVQHGSGLLRDAVQTGPGGLRVVAGARGGTDAAAIRPGEMVDALDELCGVAAHVVVDVGHRLEELAGFGVVGRYARARAAVGRADQLVVVTGGSPVGMVRVLDWIADARVLTRAPLHVVVNRLAGGRFHRGELHTELVRSVEPRSLTFVPEDRRVADAAWDGVLATRGPAAKAWSSLVGHVTATVVAA